MVDLQLSLSDQFDACTNLEKQENIHNDYEAKMNHYGRQLHYCN